MMSQHDESSTPWDAGGSGYSAGAARARARGQRGLTLTEVVVGMAILGAMMAFVFLVAGPARQVARVTTAASNLRQTGIAFEMHFSKNGGYPAYRSDLVRALQPFLLDPRVLANPLADEQTPGQVATALYRPPTSQDADRPNRYLTALSSSNGTAAAILTTGGTVQTRFGLNLPPPSPSLLAPQNDAIVYGLTGQCQIRAMVLLNPNPQSGFDFALTTPRGVITSADLAQGRVPSYSGPAQSIRFTPNGTSAANRLTFNGVVSPVDSSAPYTVQPAPGGTLNVMVVAAVDPATGIQQWLIQIVDGNGVQLTH